LTARVIWELTRKTLISFGISKGHTRQAISKVKFNFKKNINFSKIKNKSKIYKTKNQQPTNSFLPIELRNPDSPSPMERRRSEVKPCRAPFQNKNCFVCFYFYFWWKV